MKLELLLAMGFLAQEPAHDDVARLPRRDLDAPAVDALFGFEMPDREYDPLTYWRRKACVRRVYRWSEHPAGRFTIATNASGYRDDEDVRGERPDLRVVVTGDSHTDGLCANAESYANRLELELRRGHPGHSIETINAGLGGYSFYHYLGVLEKVLLLEPDAFVVGVFGGNDLAEVLLPFHHFSGRQRPDGGTEYEARVAAARRTHHEEGRHALFQGFNQLAYFTQRPRQEQLALEAARLALTEIREVCEREGIGLIVLYVPSPVSVEYGRFSELYDEVTRALGLTAEDLARGVELGDRFLATVEDLGIEALDGRKLLRSGGGPYYWRADQHFNVAGHEAFARGLSQRLGTLLE